MAGDKQHTVTRPAGFAILTGPDGTVEADSLQCGHCGRHWTVRPGSGRRRGFCTCCMRPTCGPSCPAGTAACIPQDLFLENIEKGRPLDYKPIVG